MSNETTPAEAGAADHAFEENGTDATVEVAEESEGEAGEASVETTTGIEATGTEAEAAEEGRRRGRGGGAHRR